MCLHCQMAGHNKTRSFANAHWSFSRSGQLHDRDASDLVKHLTERAHDDAAQMPPKAKDRDTGLTYFQAGAVMAIPLESEQQLQPAIELAQRLRSQSPLNVVAVATAYDARMPARKAQPLLDMGLVVVPAITDRSWRGLSATAIAQDFVKRTVQASRSEQEALLAPPH